LGADPKIKGHPPRVRAGNQEAKAEKKEATSLITNKQKRVKPSGHS